MDLFASGVTVVHGASWADNDSRRQPVRAVTIHRTEGTNSLGLLTNRSHNSPGTVTGLIAQDGRSWQFYPCGVRCSHAAGANQAGDGWELEGFTRAPAPAAQLATLGRIAHFYHDELDVPLLYRTGDPRNWVDNSGYHGFIAHRAVDYPPDRSLLHYDQITPAEWQTAVGSTVTKDDLMYVASLAPGRFFQVQDNYPVEINQATAAELIAHGVASTSGLDGQEIYDMAVRYERLHPSAVEIAAAIKAP